MLSSSMNVPCSIVRASASIAAQAARLDALKKQVAALLQGR